MLIRLISLELIEYPDELGALVLADPTQGDVPDFSLEEVNLLVNGVLVMLFDENLTLEENIEQAREHCTMWGTPDAANLEKALAQIKHYNENMALKDIGYSDRDLVLDAYGIQRSHPRSTENVIDQEMHEVGTVPELGNSTKRLANEAAQTEKP